MMMNTLLLATTLKVLAIGNSYSASAVHYLPQVAADVGFKLDFLSANIGGCSLAKQIRMMDQPSLSTHKAPWYCQTRYCDGGRPALPDPDWNHLTDVIKADTWDIITIQQCSSDSWRRASFSPWGGELIGRIRLLAPQAEIVLQETWSDPEGCPRLARENLTSASMYEQLHAAYADFAKIHGLRIIPTGTAVERARPLAALQKKVEDPHLNAAGDFLQALVWTEFLSGQDVTRGTFVPEGMDPDLAARLRAIAHAVVTR